LLCLVLTFFVLSCKKNNAPPSNGGSPGKTTTLTDSIVVSLVFQTAATEPYDYELIISEPGGKVLLDTQSAFNTTVNATLYTAQPLLDLTTIRKLTDSFMTVYTYKGVSPAQWHSLQLYMFYSAGNEGNTTPATITYTNMPSLSPSNPAINFMFGDPLPLSYTGGDANNTLTLNYDMAAGKYAYLLLPTQGLYNLHIPASTQDTVAISQTDTTTSLSYTLPTGYSFVSSTLVGIQDTTDNTKCLQLTYQLLTFPPGIQLELPPMPFEKYSGEVDASLSSSEGASYTYYGDSLQLTIPYFTPGSYTLNSTDQNNFDPVFSTTSTRYMTNWSINPYITFNIYSSPDSTEHPSALISTIASRSKFLQGISVSNLTLNSFSYYNTDNLSYADYCQKASNYNAATEQPIQKEISYSKSY